MGAGDFSLRCMVNPKDHRVASIWIAGIPFSKANLQQRLGANANSHLTPHITLQVQPVAPYPKAGCSTVALFSRLELANEGYGIGVIPWINVMAEGLEDATYPDSDDDKEALLHFMRPSTILAMATTSNLLELRIWTLLANQAAALKQPPHVFPFFQPNEPQQPQTQTGQIISLLNSRCYRNWAQCEVMYVRD